jgi:hypothetical protein
MLAIAGDRCSLGTPDRTQLPLNCFHSAYIFLDHEVQAAKAKSLINAHVDAWPKGRSAVSGVPRDAVMHIWIALKWGRFGYSDLKEAAPMGGYVL